MMRFKCAVAVTACLALLAGCATPASKSELAEKSLHEARSTNFTTQQRAELYLRAAAISAPLIGSGTAPTLARETYNAASTELTAMLRTADNGRWWNHSVTVTNAGSTYHLRYQPAVHDKIWAPDYFTTFTPVDDVKLKRVRKQNSRDGVGGELVGVRQPPKRDPFMLPRGVMTAPVTATLDFHGHDAVLALQDPRNQTTVSVQGKTHPMAANFSAPYAAYRPISELWVGLMGALRADRYMSKTGLFFLQPYDPDRIPIVFVHGLISTPQMWLNVINEIDADPVIRAKYQYWVFSYPTGNPLAYSAGRLRDDLEKIHQAYPGHRPFVLVGHSLGGLLSHMQVTTIHADDWVKGGGKSYAKIVKELPEGSALRHMFIFDANPEVGRTVFICTPHRGSDMAIGGIGELATRLIALPASVAGVITGQIGDQLSAITGSKRPPNSIYSLSPNNPTLHVLNMEPLHGPFHSIIGDRGKGGNLDKTRPQSSDGVVPYWSSHLDGAKSEIIVPGPHGSCELPQTITELRRILHLNLGTADK